MSLGTWACMGLENREVLISDEIFDAVKKVPPFQLISSPPEDEDLSKQILNTDFQIKDRQIHFKNSELLRPRFTIIGEGVIGFDKKVYLPIKLVFFKDTAGSMGLGNAN